MSAHRQMIERLRELYLRCEAEQTALHSQTYTLGALTPGLSAAQITTEEKQYHYCHGFLDGVKFFQSCILSQPAHLSSFTKKAGGTP